MNLYLDTLLLYPEQAMYQLAGILILSWLTLGILLNRTKAK